METGKKVRYITGIALIIWSFLAFNSTYEAESVYGSHSQEIFGSLILQMVVGILLAFPAFRIKSIYPKRNKLRFIAGSGIMIYNAWKFFEILFGMIKYANYYDTSFIPFLQYRTDMQIRLLTLLFYVLVGMLVCAPFIKRDGKITINFKSEHKVPLIIFSSKDIAKDIAGFLQRFQKKVKSDFSPLVDKTTWDPYATKNIKNEATNGTSFTKNDTEKSKIDQLREYKKLLDEGVISEEEFASLKSKFL